MSTSGGFSNDGPVIKIVFAPYKLAAFAISYPCFPDEKLPIYLIGSIGSKVGPAVISNFLPLIIFLF